MPDRAFFDTNVLIYAVAEGDPRSAQAEQLLSAGGALSAQILNEFVDVVDGHRRGPGRYSDSLFISSADHG